LGFAKAKVVSLPAKAIVTIVLSILMEHAAGNLQFVRVSDGVILEPDDLSMYDISMFKILCHRMGSITTGVASISLQGAVADMCQEVGAKIRNAHNKCVVGYVWQDVAGKVIHDPMREVFCGKVPAFTIEAGPGIIIKDLKTEGRPGVIQISAPEEEGGGE
jgi:hypothetical protein